MLRQTALQAARELRRAAQGQQPARGMSTAVAAAATASAVRRLAVGVPALGLGTFAAVTDEPTKVAYQVGGSSRGLARSQLQWNAIKSQPWRRISIQAAAPGLPPTPALPVPPTPYAAQAAMVPLRLGRDVVAAVSMLTGEEGQQAAVGCGPAVGG